MSKKLVQLLTESGRAPSAKLSRAQAQEIKSALANGESATVLAGAFQITYQAVYLIGLGETWKTLEPPGRVLPERPKITAALRDEMFLWKRKNKASNLDVANKFGVSTSAVSRAMKDGRAAMALRVQRAVLSSGSYDQVAKKYGIKRKEIEEFMAFVSEGGIPDRIRAEPE